MSVMRMMFAAEIRKVEIRQVGEKQLAKISVCKKNYTKEGEESSFSWLEISLWNPATFQLPLLKAGAFIAGSGEFSLRSYEKDGEKRKSADVNCTSFDVEVTDGTPKEPKQASAPAAPARRVIKPAAVPVADDTEVPF